jgi:hypothetical protein
MEDDVVEDVRGLCAEPDRIEQEIIRIVSAIPEQPENWIDDRSGIKRLIEKMRSDTNVLPALQETAIREKWTNEIAFRLVQLGKNLEYTTYGSSVPGVHQGPYDVIWRVMEDEWYTDRVPLVLECNWRMGPNDQPSMKSVADLLIARAEHRAVVCQGRDPWLTFEELVGTVESSGIKRAGDRYLLLFFVRHERKFSSHVYVAGTYKLIRDEQTGKPLFWRATAAGNKGGRKRQR